MPLSITTTYGERTNLPVTVCKAHVSIISISPLKRALLNIQITCINETVRKDDVGAKLRLPLPFGSCVKGFQILRHEQWYPAVAVPKKEAAIVVHKEKEKGRSVAAVSNVASSNVFEIEISPLPFGKETQCKLEIMGDMQELKACLPSLFESTTSVVVVQNESIAVVDDDDDGHRPVAFVGDCFGKTHFVCKIPGMEGSCSVKRNMNRIVVLWDTSSSMMTNHTNNDKAMISNRCDRIVELLNAIMKEKQGESGVNVELFVFDSCKPKLVGVYDQSSLLIDAIKSLSYDGGTNLVPLGDFFMELACCRKDNDKVDCVLVFSDGMDNVGKIPVVSDPYKIPFPIHCIADGNVVNLGCVRRIAACSALHGGCVFVKKDLSYVVGILYGRPMLRSIETDQDGEALVQEVDDGFRCVPDHRVERLNIAMGSKGFEICGILSGVGVGVSRIVASVVMGDGAVHEYVFDLADSNEDGGLNEYRCKRICLDGDKGRILGHLYAEALYEELDAYGVKSGSDVKKMKEELSVKYGFCSPEGTLLMLYELDQFKEHGIPIPFGHPLWKKSKLGSLRIEERTEKTESSEIGGMKNDSEKKGVWQLAVNLAKYFVEEEKDKDTDRDLLARDRLRHSRVPFCFGGRLFMRFIRRVRRSCLPSRSITLSSASDDARPSFACYASALPHRRSEREEGSLMSIDDGMLGSYEWGFFEQVHLSVDGMDAFAVSEERKRACTDDLDMSGGLECGGNEFSSLTRKKKLKSGNGSVSSKTQGIKAPDADPKAFLSTFEQLLLHCSTTTTNDHHHDELLWNKTYFEELQKQGGHSKASPSFFLLTAKLLTQHHKFTDAIRVCTNCLESGIDDVQMLRSVGYLLFSINSTEARHLALGVFEKVLELQPCEPQSYLDVGLAAFWMSWSHHHHDDDDDDKLSWRKDKNIEYLKSKILLSQSMFVHVLTHRWAGRFHEVEWAALILLHYLAELVSTVNNEGRCGCLELDLWPQELNVFRVGISEPSSVVGDSLLLCKEHPLRCIKFDVALMIWLGWDTDHTDVDLHVREPTGETVYYGNKKGRIGSLLSRDFTQGYGPEIYILKDCDSKSRREENGMMGEYKVSAKFYASHQDSRLTGTTSAVVWKVLKNNTDGGGLEVSFDFVRLDTDKQQTHVASAQIR